MEFPYPYVVGPTFYGVRNAMKVQGINEPVTTYVPTSTATQNGPSTFQDVLVFPNPANDLIAIQCNDLNREDIKVELLNESGVTIKTTTMHQGSTIVYFETSTLYSGTYFIKISSANFHTVRKIVLIK